MPIPMREVLRRGQEFFIGESDVQKGALRICRCLEEMGIPYALCGGLAVGRHGHLRFTQNVTVLLTRDGLRQFKERWLGRGWVERFAGSKGLVDPDNRIKIDVLLTGEIPGDGKSVPFGFPEPGAVGQPDEDGIRVLRLESLVELKLASGLTSPARIQDHADVIELIRENRLSKEYAERLHPFVRGKYEELWGYAQETDPLDV